MEYIIRNIEERDLTALVDLCAEHAAYERANFSKGGKKELLKAEIFRDNPKLFCLVVESRGEIAGYASYTFDYSTWDAGLFLYMDCLFLLPAYRGHGIGEEVMKELSQIARAHSCVNMQWHTPDFNEGAIRFYKRIGGTGKNKVRFTMDFTGSNRSD